MTPSVRAAVAGDLDAIVRMNNAAVPAVSPLTVESLEHLWGQSEQLAVVDVDGTPGAFILLLGPGCEYGSMNYAWFSERYESFYYVDRIVVGDGHRGLGLGRLLYDWAIARGSGSYPVLCAEVNVRPRNQVSLDFHDAMSFVEVGRQDTEGGAKTVVMLARPLP